MLTKRFKLASEVAQPASQEPREARGESSEHTCRSSCTSGSSSMNADCKRSALEVLSFAVPN
eukprot:6490353-Amphidinium_carterae.2